MTEKVLRLAGYDSYPSVLLGYCKRHKNIVCSEPGTDVEVARFALQIAGIPFVIDTDIEVDPDNILQLISNGTIDMAIIAMRTTFERKELVDFSMPINYYHLGFLIHYQDETEYRSFVSKPFTPEVWAILLVAVALISFIRIAATKSASVSARLTSVWITYAMLMGQAQEPFRRKQVVYALGVIGVFWLFGSLLTMMYYQAVMKSILVAPLRSKMPFRTLQQVLDAVEYDDWIILEWEFGPTPLCTEQQCQRLERLRAAGKVKFIDGTQVLDELSDNKALCWWGWENDHASYDFTEYEKEYIFIKDRDMLPDMLAFAFNKNLDTYRYRFDNALINVLLGQQAIRFHYLQPFREYHRKGHTQERFSITMYHLWEPLLFLLILHGFSIATFFFELAVRRCIECS
uniref:Solute-binding protein family 3/N-terminal domain-containing protein n=1 Tax=Plectus sambesii TaxID=2011161 RepID=A0A914XD88_9BILA